MKHDLARHKAASTGNIVHEGLDGGGGSGIH